MKIVEITTLNHIEYKVGNYQTVEITKGETSYFVIKKWQGIGFKQITQIHEIPFHSVATITYEEQEQL